MTTVEMFNMTTDAIRKEFRISNDWKPFEHKPKKWVIRNERTHGVYATGARGGSLRVVVFRDLNNAKAKAYELNKKEPVE